MTELESVARTSPLVDMIVKVEREVAGVEGAVIDSDINIIFLQWFLLREVVS